MTYFDQNHFKIFPFETSSVLGQFIEKLTEIVLLSIQGGARGSNRMAVGLTTTYVISAYQN